MVASSSGTPSRIRFGETAEWPDTSPPSASVGSIAALSFETVSVLIDHVPSEIITDASYAAGKFSSAATIAAGSAGERRYGLTSQQIFLDGSTGGIAIVGALLFGTVVVGVKGSRFHK